MVYVEDTIFAVASGHGRAGVAVVRISGPSAARALKTMIGRVPAPRHASLATLVDPESNQAIDTGLAIWFPGPASFTGEDCAELQVHGGRAIMAAVLKALGKLPGLRLAEAGEFTRRAFLNGRIDLAQAEGLADLIDSETDQQRRQALAQLAGVLGKTTSAWRQSLLQSLALVEAAIDFSDEGDAPTDILTPVDTSMRLVASGIDQLLSQGSAGERLRDGLLVVIAGLPNSGKSSLLNYLAQRDVAIVSPFAGTTRDPLVVHLDVCGYPVQLVDTAGLHMARNLIEAEGISRAQRYIERADLVLWLIDSSNSRKSKPTAGQAEIWPVWTKSDIKSSLGRQGQMEISTVTGIGIEALLVALAAFAETRLGTGSGALVTRERHRLALEQTRCHLRELEASAAMGQLELMAEDLRRAGRALGTISGHVAVEEVLGEIFSRFCIGK